jgi:outer membrane autotransporter protein
MVNNETITMVDQAVGDSLILPGDYTANSTLAIDVNSDGAGSADTLVIAGAASGSTDVFVNEIGASPVIGNSILVVDAGAGSLDSAFQVADNSRIIGFLFYTISYDAANNDYYLGNTIATPVFQLPKFGEGATSLWYRSADAWGAHMTSRRDAPATRRTPFWMQFYGANTNRDESFPFTSGGVTQQVVVDYNQDFYGFQTGYELGQGTSGDGLVYGATGGYLTSHLGFDGTADQVRYQDFNFGLYLGYMQGGFFANALAKYDFLNMDIVNVTAGYGTNTDGAAYGVRGEVGYRWDGGGWFIEPVASIEWQQADIDSFSALGATVDFDGFDGLRGQAGARLGGQSGIGGGSTLTYYLGGHVVHEFAGEGDVLFTSGGVPVSLTNDPIDTYGRFELGLNILTVAGVSGFIEGSADIGSGYDGWGGRAGIRIPF